MTDPVKQSVCQTCRWAQDSPEACHMRMWLNLLCLNYKPIWDDEEA